jgi:predicted RNase H-like nuclease (RuvC/YqgF family)
MSKLEKRQIGAHIEDVHIRDSYAAAVKAYRRYQNRLRQIDSMPVGARGREELKKMAICGQRIADALNANI